MRDSMEPASQPEPGGLRRAILRVVSVLQRVLELSMKILSVATGTIIGATLALGVFYRYILEVSFPLSGALPAVLFPWFIMSGAILAALHGEHISVDYFLRKLPRPVEFWILFFTKLLIIVAFVALVFISLELLPRLRAQTVPLLGWPASWAFISLPLGFAGLAFYTLLDLLASSLKPSTQASED